MNGTAGVYSLTVDLLGTGYIKFITTLGQWAPMYGTDASGTSTGGSLVYRPDEATADPAAIPVPATAGTYTVHVNTNDLTYTIE
jgi:hydrogenase maturation factor